MKKSLIFGILGLAATAVSSYGQGVIVLNNYDNSGPAVTYGQSGIPANGVSGTAGTQGAGLAINDSWTVGVYYVLGTPTIGSDPNSNPTGDPSTFTGGLALGSGANSTAAFVTAGFPGLFTSGGAWAVPGTSSAGGTTVTLELVAYSGANYDASSYRGHSASFTMQVSANSSPSPVESGPSEPGFSVYSVPEPSIFALSGIGAAALMLIRRKK